MRRNVLGSKLERLVVTSGRAGCVALVFQDVVQGVVGLGEVRIAPNDTVGKAHGRAGVVSGFAVHGLGLGQAARLLVAGGPGLRLLGMSAEGARLRTLKVPARSSRRSGRPR